LGGFYEKDFINCNLCNGVFKCRSDCSNNFYSAAPGGGLYSTVRFGQDAYPKPGVSGFYIVLILPSPVSYCRECIFKERRIMGATENKQLMRNIFAELSKGNGKPFVEIMADDFCRTISGTTEWSKTYLRY